MPARIIRFETTPNPNAIKCVLDRVVCNRPRSFLCEHDAQTDPIATQIFALGGIRNILINDDWISINKLENAKWTTLKPALRKLMPTLTFDDPA